MPSVYTRALLSLSLQHDVRMCPGCKGLKSFDTSDFDII